MSRKSLMLLTGMLTTIFGCTSVNTNKLTALQYKMTQEPVYDSLGMLVRTERKLVKEVPNAEPEIVVLDYSEKSVIYEIKGFYPSSGLSARRIKSVKVSGNLQNGQFTITNDVEIVPVSGKESNLVFGYNYVKNKKVRLPKGVRKVRILVREFGLVEPITEGKLLVERTILM